MKQIAAVIIPLSLLLAGCSLMNSESESTPASAAATSSGNAEPAVQISRNQVGSLVKSGNITVSERGSPMDAEQALQQKANENGARYYQVIYISETVTPGVWRGEAITYR